MEYQKLRAWDELNKVMHMDFQFIASGDEQNDWIVFKSDKQTLQNKEVFDNPYARPQLKIMGGTGLTDDSDQEVEIYANDFVKVWEEDDAEDEMDAKMYEVIYCGDKGYPAYDLSPDLDIDANGLAYMKANGKVKVVGNRYQNPELIKLLEK